MGGGGDRGLEILCSAGALDSGLPSDLQVFTLKPTFGRVLVSTTGSSFASRISVQRGAIQHMLELN